MENPSYWYGGNQWQPIWHFLEDVYWKYVLIIALKAPGNHLDQFRSNKILAFLWQGQKPPNSKFHDFWIFGPRWTFYLWIEHTKVVHKY